MASKVECVSRGVARHGPHGERRHGICQYGNRVRTGAFEYPHFVQTGRASSMRRIAVSAMREHVADVLAHVAARRERIILTRHGRDLGVIVPLEDLERLHAVDEEGLQDSSRTMTAYRTSWRRVTDALHGRH